MKSSQMLRMAKRWPRSAAHKRQIFQQGQPEATGRPAAGSGSTPWGIPPIGDILGEPKKDVANRPATSPADSRAERSAKSCSDGFR
jgi:hypothetical protein